MRKYFIPILLYIGIMTSFASCVNEEDTLLDLFPNEPIVNPAVGLLINGSHIEQAIMIGPTEIRGFSSSNYFETPDLFYDTIHIGSRPSSNFPARISYQHLGRAFYLAPYSAEFGISSDYGRTWAWHTLQPAVHSPADDLVSAYGLTESGQRFLVLASISAGAAREAHLYEYNEENRTSTLRHSFGTYRAKALCFATDAIGWALLESANGGQLYITKTNDGGYSWSSPTTISYIQDPAPIAASPMHLLIYDRGARQHCLSSADGGQTFVNGPMLTDAQYVSENKIYAINGSLFYTSADGGHSWASGSSSAYKQDVRGQRLSFYDTDHGIVYAHDCLFNTSDGGKTWDIAIFPYPYVYEAGQ